MVSEALFSSRRPDWCTPQALFDELDAEFHFTLDPCADACNHKCEKYYTEFEDGLAQNWSRETVFCNPPYGRQIEPWVAKCCAHDGTAVLLVPARTDTRWFHEFIYRNSRAEVRFIRGRLRFDEAKAPAPFPSMVVIFRGRACPAVGAYDGEGVITTNENVISRLEAELADLSGKIKRLKAFDDKHYNGGEFIGDIDGDNYEAQHRALVSQLSHMTSYARAIEWRIEILRDLKAENDGKAIDCNCDL